MKIEERHFTQRNIQEALRRLDAGMANAWFQSYVADGILQAPDIDEFTVKIWTYESTVELIRQVFGFKKRIFDIEEINKVLSSVKEGNEKKQG